jgi:hypothetical protein
MGREWDYSDDVPTPILDRVADAAAAFLDAAPAGAACWEISKATGEAKSTINTVMRSPRPRHGGRFAEAARRGRMVVWCLVDRVEATQAEIVRRRENRDDLALARLRSNDITFDDIERICRRIIRAELDARDGKGGASAPISKYHDSPDDDGPGWPKPGPRPKDEMSGEFWTWTYATEFYAAELEDRDPSPKAIALALHTSEDIARTWGLKLGYRFDDGDSSSGET